jgi:hypothetical protein
VVGSARTISSEEESYELMARNADFDASLDELLQRERGNKGFRVALSRKNLQNHSSRKPNTHVDSGALVLLRMADGRR